MGEFTKLSQRVLKPLRIDIRMDECIQSIMDDLESSFLKSKIAFHGKKKTYLLSGIFAILAYKAVGGESQRRIIHGARGLSLLNLAGSAFDDLFDDHLMISSSSDKVESSASLCSGANIITRSITEIARACEDLTPQKREEVFRIVEKGVASAADGFQYQIKNLGEIDITEDEYIESVCLRGGGIWGEVSAKIGGILGDGDDISINALGNFGRNYAAALQVYDHMQEVGEDIKYGFFYPPFLQALDWDDTTVKVLSNLPIDDVVLDMMIDDNTLRKIKKNFRGIIERLLDESISHLNVIPECEAKDLMFGMIQALQNCIYKY